ncbi:MAG TPA: hypothetical protein VGX76_13645, partial [Pirellulales bacterium]|nr:hypothetical protein [Pirellulales bacterium]
MGAAATHRTGTIGLIVIIGMARSKHERSLAAIFQPWPDWLKKGQRDNRIPHRSCLMMVNSVAAAETSPQALSAELVVRYNFAFRSAKVRY